MPKKLLDLYIEGSLHVAFAVFALIQVTRLRLGLEWDWEASAFGFSGTVVGYNFVKYDAIARHGQPSRIPMMRVFIALSILSGAGALWAFLKLPVLSKIIGLASFGITALYTLPFFPNRRTARDWAGLKIYFVALCWAGITVAVPVADAGVPFSTEVWLMCLQRFILVVVLLFVFEIIDLSWDDPHLKTVPQQLGVRNTKILGTALLLVLILLEWSKHFQDPRHGPVNLMFVGVTGVFLWFAESRRSRYYSTFWTEALPLFWWLMLELQNP